MPRDQAPCPSPPSPPVRSPAWVAVWPMGAYVLAVRQADDGSLVCAIRDRWIAEPRPAA